MIGQCLYCGNKLSDKKMRVYAKYCSNECVRKHYKEKYNIKSFGQRKLIDNPMTGATHELMVCVELMKAGIHSFRSQSPSCPCDLIALKEGTTYLIEVTTGYRLRNGNLSYPKHRGKNNIYDIMAVVIGAGEIIYLKNGLEITLMDL